jgi:hypothetical protein
LKRGSEGVLERIETG